MRKICVVTGTRAEYGLLYWLMKEIENDDELQLQLIVTGMHLSPEFGLTYKTIEQDGFHIDEKVEMLLSSDSPVGIAKSIGLGVIGFAESLARLKPDIAVVLGDRFEILAAVQAAMVAKIPVAHIAGGDVTEGAVDEAIRHSITKMAHLHFTTNEEASRRVCQLGENPAHVYNVGSPGIDFIKRVPLMTRQKLEQDLDFVFLEKNVLITFHPATLDDGLPQSHFKEILDALDELGGNTGLIFTKPNSDAAGRIIIKMMEEYAATHANAKVYTSLGQVRYLSMVNQVDLVLGNSSSGLYEVPSFKTPTVNIGDRQTGRLKAQSVVSCGYSKEEIYKAIQTALALDCSQAINPYGDGNATMRILRVLKSYREYKSLLKKRFYEVSC